MVIEMSLEKLLLSALKSREKIKIEQIFNEIYRTYIKLVYFIVAQYVDNQLDIEEICNDVFLNFFNHLDKIKVKNIKYYLVTSAKNTSLNFLRKEKYQYIPIKKEVEISEKNKIICCFLNDCLDEDEKWIIFEHLYLNKPLRLIAKEKNINPNTLKSRYRRILIKLKEKVGEDIGE